MRRLLAGVAAGLALLLLVPAPPAGAQSAWEGSYVTTAPQTASSTFDLTARFIRSYNANVPGVGMSARTWLTPPAGLPAGCLPADEVELPTDIRTGDAPDSTDTYLRQQVTVPCNGTYAFRVRATLSRGLLAPDEHQLSGSIKVVARPPEVPKANAVVDGGVVVVSWTQVSSPPVDFLGYRIERRVSGGGWEAIAAKLDPNKKTFNDSSAPIGSAEIAYRVRSRRASPPDGEVLSEGAGATIAADGTTVPPGTDGGTSVPPDTDGGATDGGAGPGADGGADGGGEVTDGGGRGSSRGSGGGIPSRSRGRTGIGTRAPRLGTPSQANFPPLLTPGDGEFDEEIDYGNRSLAGEDDDELSSLFYEEETGEGMAVPVAIGFVLAAWAFHLRFLAKASRPVPVPLAVAVAPGAGRAGAPRHREPDRPAPTVRAEPAIQYVPPAHYGPPSLADRYDPFAR